MLSLRITHSIVNNAPILPLLLARGKHFNITKHKKRDPIVAYKTIIQWIHHLVYVGLFNFRVVPYMYLSYYFKIE